MISMMIDDDVAVQWRTQVKNDKVDPGVAQHVSDRCTPSAFFWLKRLGRSPT